MSELFGLLEAGAKSRASVRLTAEGQDFFYRIQYPVPNYPAFLSIQQYEALRGWVSGMIQRGDGYIIQVSGLFQYPVHLTKDEYERFLEEMPRGQPEETKKIAEKGIFA